MKTGIREPLPKIDHTIVHCAYPACPYRASGLTAEATLKSLTAHIEYVHVGIGRVSGAVS